MAQEVIPIYICNFNTTALTNNAIRSIMQHIHNFAYTIYVLDNSNKDKFILEEDLKAQVLDNTQSQLVQYEYAFKYNFKVLTPNNHASAKHAYAIDWIVKNCNSDKFLLFDSDIILLQDIDFISDEIVTAAHVLKYTKFGTTLHRFEPFIQYFNVKLMNKYQINYYDPYRMHGGLLLQTNCYDTGASFFEDVVLHKAPFKDIDYTQYIKHLGGKSWMPEMVKNYVYKYRKI